MVNIRTLVDMETGELLEVASYRTVAQQEAYAAKLQKEKITKYRNKTDNPFIFTEMGADTMHTLNNLTNKQLGYFLVLQSYINYDNVLTKPDARKPMALKEVQEALKIACPKTFRLLIKAFEEAGVASKQLVTMYGKEYKAIVVNAAYCFKKGIESSHSKRSVTTTTKLFVEEFRKVFDADKVTPTDIGIIYKAIQFLPHSHNTLVNNPFEKDLENAESLNLNAFCELVGINKDNLLKQLQRLEYPVMWKGREAMMKVFSRNKIGREVQIKINPLIVNRRAVPPVEAEYAEFVLEWNKRKNKTK